MVGASSSTNAKNQFRPRTYRAAVLAKEELVEYDPLHVKSAAQVAMGAGAGANELMMRNPLRLLVGSGRTGSYIATSTTNPSASQSANRSAAHSPLHSSSNSGTATPTSNTTTRRSKGKTRLLSPSSRLLPSDPFIASGRRRTEEQQKELDRLRATLLQQALEQEEKRARDLVVKVGSSQSLIRRSTPRELAAARERESILRPILASSQIKSIYGMAALSMHERNKESMQMSRDVVAEVKKGVEREQEKGSQNNNTISTPMTHHLHQQQQKTKQPVRNTDPFIPSLVFQSLVFPSSASPSSHSAVLGGSRYSHAHASTAEPFSYTASWVHAPNAFNTSSARYNDGSGSNGEGGGGGGGGEVVYRNCMFAHPPSAYARERKQQRREQERERKEAQEEEEEEGKDTTEYDSHITRYRPRILGVSDRPSTSPSTHSHPHSHPLPPSSSSRPQTQEGGGSIIRLLVAEGSVRAKGPRTVGKEGVHSRAHTPFSSTRPTLPLRTVDASVCFSPRRSISGAYASGSQSARMNTAGTTKGGVEYTIQTYDDSLPYPPPPSSSSPFRPYINSSLNDTPRVLRREHVFGKYTVITSNGVGEEPLERERIKRTMRREEPTLVLQSTHDIDVLHEEDYERRKRAVYRARRMAYQPSKEEKTVAMLPPTISIPPATSVIPRDTEEKQSSSSSSSSSMVGLKITIPSALDDHHHDAAIDSFISHRAEDDPSPMPLDGEEVGDQTEVNAMDVQSKEFDASTYFEPIEV